MNRLLDDAWLLGDIFDGSWVVIVTFIKYMMFVPSKKGQLSQTNQPKDWFEQHGTY